MKYLYFPIIIILAVLFGIISCQMKPGISQLLVEEGDATSADGIPIHYKLYGKGDVSLVFVHDWCTNMKYWDEQINPFVESLINKARSGVDVRVIMNFNPYYDDTNYKISSGK